MWMKFYEKLYIGDLLRLFDYLFFLKSLRKSFLSEVNLLLIIGKFKKWKCTLVLWLRRFIATKCKRKKH